MVGIHPSSNISCVDLTSGEQQSFFLKRKFTLWPLWILNLVLVSLLHPAVSQTCNKQICQLVCAA